LPEYGYQQLNPTSRIRSLKNKSSGNWRE
jgi:hypothetical protein